MRSRLASAGWALGAVLVAAWLAVVEVFWLPLRVGGVPVPLSVLAAAAGNVLLVLGAHRLSGSRAVAVVPVAVWLVVVLGALVRRPEGDLLLVGSGTLGLLAMVFVLVGVLAAGFAVARVLSGSAGQLGRGSSSVSG